MMVPDALENIATRSETQKIVGIENLGESTSGGAGNQIHQT